MDRDSADAMAQARALKARQIERVLRAAGVDRHTDLGRVDRRVAEQAAGVRRSSDATWALVARFLNT